MYFFYFNSKSCNRFSFRRAAISNETSFGVFIDKDIILSLNDYLSYLRIIYYLLIKAKHNVIFNKKYATKPCTFTKKHNIIIFIWLKCEANDANLRCFKDFNCDAIAFEISC